MKLLHSCGAIALLSCTAAAPLAPPPVVFQRPSGAAHPVSSVSPPVPVASPSLPPPSTPRPLVSQGDIGQSGPLTLLAASSSAAWVALCQGEPPSATLVLGSGLGEPIEDVLAHDAGGRYVVVKQDGAAKLLDTTLGSRFDLSSVDADVRKTRHDYAVHRTLSFDAQGRHLAYARQLGGAAHIVVRDLERGREQTFAVGIGEVYRLRLSPDARYVSFDILRQDTTNNGRLDWPVPEERPSTTPCRAGLPRLRTYAHLGRGDALTKGVVSVNDGVVRELPELVTPLGASLLVREADGSLRLDQAGKRSPFASAACAGRVLLADAEREQALVTCVLPKRPGKREVWLLSSRSAKNLKAELYETSTDREPVIGVRLAALYPGSESSVVDLERRELRPLAPGSRVLQVSGSAALVWRGNELFRFDAESGKEQRLVQGVLRNPDLLQSGRALLLSPFVVVDAAAPVLMSPTPQPLALSSSGHVLAAASSRAGADAAPAASTPQGPLHWLEARPPPSDGSVP